MGSQLKNGDNGVCVRGEEKMKEKKGRQRKKLGVGRLGQEKEIKGRELQQ